MKIEGHIRLIVGLGNHGAHYENTRHNVGYWFTQALAAQYHLTFHLEAKFKGLITKLASDNKDHWLLQPQTYMNNSGESVKSLMDFYKIPPQSILVIHDELDFASGIIRLKYDGGHGGHNGLRSIISHLHTKEFYRLRIGIGHPGIKDKVSDYVLSSPPTSSERQQIQRAIQQGLSVMPTIFAGNMTEAIQTLHTDRG